ncbi:MAG: AsmA family protein [Bacteroidaceae bacterium]|nr:AsmA family protein [Bacteroidaceae bacterium]MBR5890514.1 AsmA family protein [Bacteroidaceae bacterium]
MKKLLKTTATVFVIILVLLMVLPYAFKGKIETIIKTEGNKMLNAQFDFESLNISLLSQFPSASISLENFWLKGVGEFENDTLLRAGELTAAVNIMSIFSDTGFEISKIIIDDTKAQAIILEDGRPNWDVMKMDTTATEEVADSTSTPFRIQLRKLSINDLTLIYDDRQAGMYASIANLDAACSGDFGSERTTLELEAETPALTFRMGEIPFLSNAKIGADMNIDADFTTNKFTLKENTLSLNAIRATIDGWVAMTESGIDMDLKLNSNEISFKEILSLVPAIYAKDFDGLKTAGEATLAAYAKGSMIGDSIMPEFDVNLQVKDAMFRYPSLPAGVDKINIAASVKNPGGSLDATTVNVNPFNFTLAGNPFSMTADVKTPISDLVFNLAAKGKLDLGKIKDVYPLEDMQLNGLVNADMSVNGRMSYIQKEQYDKMQASGSINLNDMKLQMSDIPDVLIKKSTFSFTPRYLKLSETTVNIGENDLTFDSQFENYMGFALKGTTLKGTLNIASNKFNLNDFMSSDSTAAESTTEAASDTAAMGVIEIPDNIDFRMQVKMKQVLMNKMQFNDLNGLLIVKDSKVDMQNLSLGTMGGTVVVNGSYATPKNSEPKLNAGFSLNNIVFAQAYRDLDMVQKLAPIFNGLKGDFSGNIKVNTLLDNTMSPIMSSLNGSGSLSTKDISLSGVKAIDMVADIVKKPELKEAKVKDLKIDFTIADGRINTKPFDLKLGDYTMNLSGSTGLDQSINYTGKIAIPQSLGKVSQLGTVDMNIGGTFTSPKVSIDMESLAKKAATNAIEKAGEKLVDKLLGGSTTKTEATDSTATEEKKDVKEQLLNKAINLLKKK